MSAHLRSIAADEIRSRRRVKRDLLADSYDEFLPPRAVLALREQARAIDTEIETILRIVHRVERAEIDQTESELRATLSFMSFLSGGRN